MRFSKRGLSPVVATALLIALVIVIALIVFLWSRGFLSEQIEKFGEPIEKYCSRVQFEFQVDELVGSGGKYEVIALNRGDVGISGFEIKRVNGGDSEVMVVNLKLPAGGYSASSEIETKLIDGRIPERILVYPILEGNIRGKGASGRITCYDYQKIIVLN